MRILKITALGLMLTSGGRMSRPCPFAGGACRIAIAIALLLAVPTFAWTAETRQRVFVLTDIGNEPDDAQSMVRLLTYSNRVDIEGLVATTSTHMPSTVMPHLISERIAAYGQVRANLLLHEPGFPTVDQLNAITKTGVPKLGMDGVGAGNDSSGSELLIAAVDKADPRPLWVSIWGGPNTLAQALWKVQQTRSAPDVAAFVSKLRVFAITDQDGSGGWINGNFPQLFYMTGASWLGFSHRGDEWNWLTNNPWIDQHVQVNHGPLGALYPDIQYGMEGDTPSWLYLIPVGLGDLERPDFGSWGGRYGNRNSVNRLYEDVEDTFNGQTNIFATVYRWRQGYQNDFEARMDWNVKPYVQANHPPVAVVDGALARTVAAGSLVTLSAAGSSDPDGNELSYEWIYYDEPSGYNGPITISNATQQQTLFAAPQVTTPQTVHIILAVRDNGTPNLFRYQRVIVTVTPTGNQVPSVSLTAPATNASYVAPASINLTANASDSDGSVSRVEFYQGMTKLGEDDSAPYAFTWTNVAPGSYSLSARAIDNTGAAAVSTAANVIVDAANNVFYRAINLNGTAVTIDGRVWEGKTAGNYSTVGGTPFEYSGGPLIPETDAARTSMIRSFLSANGGNISATMENVPNGSYAVYLYVWENDGLATFNVLLEGSVVQANYTSSPAGAWARLGPWTTTISDGTIQVACSGTVSDANISGLEVWRQGGSTPGNQAPVVALTAPALGANYTAPAAISLTSTASDADGTVAKVEFYQGSTKLGEDTSAPYNFTWSNVAAGSYSLTARATDNAGAVTISAARTVTVQAPGGLTAVYFDNIDFTGASISRIDGPVDFDWGNGSPAAAIGADSFSARWTGQVEVPATGTWTFTTTSDDGIRLWVNGVQLINAWVDQGPTSYSGSIALTAGQRYDLKLEYFENIAGAMARLAWSGPGQASQVIPRQYLAPTSGAPTNAAPTVALTAPANGATAPGSFAINATAADSDGTIAKVEFFAGATRLGEDTSAPYTYTWNNVAAGTYSLTAKATDNAGASTTSTAVSVTVMDLQTVRDHFGTRLGDPGWTGQGDANGDGRVDAADVSVVVRALGN